MSLARSGLIAMIVLGWMMVVGATPSWWSLDESRNFTGADGVKVNVSVMAIDLGKARLRIVSVPFEAATVSPGASELSLSRFAEILVKDKKYLGREWIAVNGGFSSYRVDVPLGLLIVDRKVYSTVTLEKSPKGYSSDSAEFGRFRWSGVLCQLEPENRWDVIATGRYTPGRCNQALQGGPVLVEPNAKIGISPNELNAKTPFKRTAVCLADDARMMVVVTRNETHLFPLATWLSKPESLGGLGCRVALNLSGDSSSAIAIKSSPKAPARLLGEGSFPIPTALIFDKR